MSQRFPLEFLFVVLQWFRWIAENIFSWTFAAEIGHYDRKKRQAREKTTGNSFRGHLSMPGFKLPSLPRFDRKVRGG
ncbi:MAG: hypothetical protein OXD29_11805, partial [Roseovarius sp.]|nr:hypothetical protein [Roseovarius sp.]